MAKKNPPLSDKYGAQEVLQPAKTFYFGKKNFQLMLIGLGLIILGFILMLGADANTIDGKFDTDNWNEGIFSFRRIRLAPLLVVAGFVVEVYAILRRNK